MPLTLPQRVITSSTEPTIKVNRTWLETDSSGNALYPWEWVWNGTYWLSPPLKFNNYSTHTSLSISSILKNADNLDLYIHDFIRSWYLTGTHNVGNNFLVSLNRRSSANVSTIISSFSTNGATADSTWRRLVNTVNTPIDVSAVDVEMLEIGVSQNGTPGNMFANSECIYSYARPT